MNLKNEVYYNWGRNSKIKPKIISPKNCNELKKVIKNKNFIIQGNKRSYGDVTLNKKLLISMKNFNQIKYFNKKKGIIEIESGVLLKDFITKITDYKWFVSVTPGTKYVSLGGMVANNIHGKNIINNQLKHFIKEIKLLKTNNKLKVNFSKDLITNKKNAYNFPEFKNFKIEISRLNKKRKLSSYFSERLGI